MRGCFFFHFPKGYTYQHPVAQGLLALQSCPRTSSAKTHNSMLNLSICFPNILANWLELLKNIVGMI